jgi:serine/threonine protein kinase
LGITLLELAETNPPLHEVHPMKALMMIPMKDPPAFTQPERWSREFKDFVQQCLTKQPEKRKTAEEMLKVQI